MPGRLRADDRRCRVCGYDGVYRLTAFERGALNANKDDITSPDRSQTWSLDPLGNWDSTVNDGTAETRVHNSVNELTARTVGEDPQISLTYDDAGQPEGRPGPMVANTPYASHLAQDGRGIAWRQTVPAEAGAEPTGGWSWATQRTTVAQC